jgi:hypothetical protein
MKFRVKLAACLAILFFAHGIAAQTITASLEGIVQNSTGAALPSARLRVLNANTNVASSGRLHDHYRGDRVQAAATDGRRARFQYGFLRRHFRNGQYTTAGEVWFEDPLRYGADCLIRSRARDNFPAHETIDDPPRARFSLT